MGDLLTSSHRLIQWLLLLYSVMALSCAERYWHLLPGRLGIGCMGWLDFWGWFRGFSLTANPARLGELNWVQQLHEQLGYLRLPLVHVLVLERFADSAAVVLLLLVLTPAQVLGLLRALSSPGLAVGCEAAGCTGTHITAITLSAAMAAYLLSGTAGMSFSLLGGIGVNEVASMLLLGQQGCRTGALCR